MAIINNLNGDKVEFTGVSRVWNNTKYDFEEVYFGDKQIFSIWAKLESPLPITILAAGEDLIDYRIYGNTENGESVGERTENLLDKVSANIINNRKLDSTGAEVYSNGYFCVTKYIPIFAGTEYSVYNPNSSSDTFHAFYDANKNFLTSFSAVGHNLQTATSPANAAYIKCSLLSYTRFPDAFASSMLFEGSTAPTSYIPYGYQLPMVVRSENLLDKNAPDYENSCFYDQNNTKYINIDYAESGYIPVEAGTYSIVTTVPVTGRVLIANFFDTNKNFYSNLLYRINPPKVSTLTIPSDGYVRFNISLGTAYTNAFMFIEGSTAPTEYIPYYRDEENIYIGSDPLAEDEYVDFGEQKIYRMEGGTLTPTDPPVPIPALPTIEGETVIDYNPSTTPAVEPEKMYTKYRKEGF